MGYRCCICPYPTDLLALALTFKDLLGSPGKLRVRVTAREHLCVCLAPCCGVPLVSGDSRMCGRMRLPAPTRTQSSSDTQFSKRPAGVRVPLQHTSVDPGSEGPSSGFSSQVIH